MAETKKRDMITAVFRDRMNADSAWSWLNANGYSPNEINMLMSESTKARYLADHDHEHEAVGASTHVAEGAAIGGAVGTAIGATAAAIAAIGTAVFFPPLGWIIGSSWLAGPIAGALAGGGAGAVTGGVIGGLIGLGIPESNARAYEEALRDGGIVIGVTPHNSDDASRIKDKFQELHGDNVISI